MTTLAITAMAHGGDGIGRIDGKTVFVPGAVEGDVVRVDLVENRKRFARGALREVVEPSAERIEAPCPHFGTCGGCAWQQVPVGVQRRWKQETVAGLLRHIGRLDDVTVRPIAGPSAEYGYRNRMDFRTQSGRPALFEAGTHTRVPIDTCLLLHPSLGELFDRLAGVDVGGIVTLRAGVRTGERAMIVDEAAVDPLRARGVPATTESRAVVHELIAGRRLRITGRSFFQVNTEGAERLVELAGEAAGDLSGRHLLDGYAGGGLFAACLGRGADRVTAIESDPVAGDDLAANVPGAELIRQTVESGLEQVETSPDVMIADPPRAGMGEGIIDRIAELRPPVVVVVACDPAGFARDARLLVDRGYRVEWVAPVDMFPQTPHIETVARFVVR